MAMCARFLAVVSVLLVCVLRVYAGTVPDLLRGPPTNLEFLVVNATMATIFWTDGAGGVPPETYTVRCFEGGDTDCKSTGFVAEVTGIPRGGEEGMVADLDPYMEYTCYVLAVNDDAPDGICSGALTVDIDSAACVCTVVPFIV